MSRKQMQCSVDMISDLYKEQVPQSSSSAVNEPGGTGLHVCTNEALTEAYGDPLPDEALEDVDGFTDMFLINVCLFY